MLMVYGVLITNLHITIASLFFCKIKDNKLSKDSRVGFFSLENNKNFGNWFRRIQICLHIRLSFIAISTSKQCLGKT